MKTNRTKISGIAKVASIGAIASVISLTNAVAAQQHNYNIARRAQKQQNHVQQGIKSGTLTRSDVNDIKTQAKDLKADMSSARASNNGHLTTAERKDAIQTQNQLASEIYQFKHNQTAVSAAPSAVQKSSRGMRVSPGPRF